MIEIIKTTRDHVVSILGDDYNKDTWLKDEIIDGYAKSKYAYTFYCTRRESALAVMGIAVAWEGRGEAWALFRQGTQHSFVSMVKAAKEFLQIVPLRRIEATVRGNFLEGHRLARMLGFKCETYEMKNFGPSGEFYSMYVILKETT